MFYQYIALVLIPALLILYYTYIPRFFTFKFNSRFGFAIIIGNVPPYFSIVSGVISDEVNRFRFSPLIILLILAIIYVVVNKYDKSCGKLD